MLQLLAPERVAIAFTEPDQDAEASARAIAPQLSTPAQDHLQTIRIGLRDIASATAVSIRRLSQATVSQALKIGQRLWQMQRDLKRKEYNTFLGVLGWASTKAKKFVNLAKTFSEFESSQLSGIELTTMLSLCSKRYQSLVGQLREMQDITQQLVEELIKENRASRKPKQDPISGWKQNRAGGGRRYEVILLHDEETGLSIEQQAEAEGTLPHKVLAEAVALRAKQKSGGVLISGYRAAQLEEFPMVIEHTRTLEREKRGLELELAKRDHTIAELEAKLTGGALLPAEICSEELTGLHIEQGLELEFLEPLHFIGDELEAQVEQTAEPEATDSPELVLEEDPAQPLEAVEETSSGAIFQEAGLLPEQETDCLTPSDDSAADCQLIKPDWDMLQQLRGAEAGLREIDTQIKLLNDKLANLNSGEVVKRELAPVLKKQQNLRSAKISEIVELINSNSIPAYYEELENVGRVVLEPKYASVALKQSKTWKDVVLVVGGDRAQLLKAVDSWTLEQRQVLVQMLSTYLETEPSGLEYIVWVPKTLLQKALTNLSFKLRKIGGPNNLVDEPQIEYVSNCNFVSLEHPGSNREQWIFQDRDNKRYSVFGRDEIEIERF